METLRGSLVILIILIILTHILSLRFVPNILLQFAMKVTEDHGQIGLGG
jgi:hypothetical protein